MYTPVNSLTAVPQKMLNTGLSCIFLPFQFCLKQKYLFKHG